ncbi:MAG: cytochrome c biogenesis protein ResB, partial [Lachnospiraceae bacterium]|nr:cytochrome c biogenesis protein ResB [Lachnospiraceae bacterium]
QYSLYGLPGDSAAIGETGCILTIDSFDVDLREDDTVSQYRAGITVRRPSDGSQESGEISVNHPASIFGMKFFQNSTGWAADIHIRKKGEPIQDQVIYAGEFTAVEDMPDLVIYLNAFYPDYVLDPEKGPMSASSSVKNPAYLYSVYYAGSMLGMNALLESEELTIDDYTVTFDNPRNYTLIQIKRDRFTFLALLGGLTVLAGLILAFYLQEARIWAVLDEEGTWTVHGISRKGGVLFGERLLGEAEKYK